MFEKRIERSGVPTEERQPKWYTLVQFQTTYYENKTPPKEPWSYYVRFGLPNSVKLYHWYFANGDYETQRKAYLRAISTIWFIAPKDFVIFIVPKIAKVAITLAAVKILRNYKERKHDSLS